MVSQIIGDAQAIHMLSEAYRRNDSPKARKALLHAIDYLRNPGGYSKPHLGRRSSVRNCATKARMRVSKFMQNEFPTEAK